MDEGRTTVHELVMAKSLKPGNFGPDPSRSKTPTSIQCLRLLVRFPGRHLTPQITFHVQHRPRKCDDSRATIHNQLCFQTKTTSFPLITNLPGRRSVATRSSELAR